MTTTTLDSTETAQANPLNQFFLRRLTLNWETTLYIVIFLLAIFTRFYNLGDRVMSHDESLHTRYSYNLYSEGVYEHTPLMHGPVLFHMTALSYFLFGDNDFTARIYTALLGIGIVMFPFLFRRWLGRWGALLASLMLLISPLMMYYNRYIREDTPSIFYTLIMVYCIMMYLSGPENLRRRGYWLYIFSGAMLLSLASKEVAFIYIFILASFLLIYFLSRLAQDLLRLPAQTLFYFITIGTLLGGVASLAMYVILDIVPFDTARLAAEASGGWFNSVESRSFIIWTVLAVVAVIGSTVGTMLWVLSDGRSRPRWQEIAIIVLIGLFATLAFIVAEEVSHVQPSAEETAQPIVPGEEQVAAPTTNIRWWPMYVTWALGALAVGVILFGKNAGWWRYLERYPEFDVLVVTGSLGLPWITAIVPFLMKGSSADYAQIASSLPQFLNDGLSNVTAQFSTVPVGLIVLYFLAAVPLFAVAITAGLVWNWRRWVVCVTVFHVLFAFFFTTVFTNVEGLFSGMFYSLGYWLEQQGVRRGSQPQYYYLVLIMPFYEFLPVIGSVLAMWAGLIIFWRRRRAVYEQQGQDYIPDNIEYPETAEHHHEADSDAEVPSLEEVIGDDEIEALVASHRPAAQVTWLDPLPFLPLVAWWAVLNLVFYSLAGEKMPWLGTHLTMPMILLTGWYFGRIFDKLELRRFLERGWLYLVLLPVLFVTLIHVASPYLVGQSPFGLTQTQLAQTGQWLSTVVISAVLIFIIYRLAAAEEGGWLHLWRMFSVAIFAALAVITFRSAWMASFINYDYATEYLVYAHGAPAVKTVLNELEELSVRTTDGKDMVFAYDNEVSWPYSWYFRDFPNAMYVGANPSLQRLSNAVAVVVGDANRAKVEPLLEDRYLDFEYIRLWWPMQDYFGLTAERIANTFDFSPENPTAASIRKGIFDIWWSRDYTTYGKAVNRDFNVTRWPVSDRMHVYIRKDIAAQIWPYGVGNGGVITEDTAPVSQCNANFQQLYANVLFQTPPSPLSFPRGVAVGPDGRVYVIEEGTHRISIFDKDGNFLRTFGEQGPSDVAGAFFNRPNGISIAPNGDIVVADTWNYRIQRFNAAGELLSRWGKAGEYGWEAKTDPVDGLWGPRDVAVDGQGRVYVADTGNKRVRVYTSDGQFIQDIGSGGSALGQLDEPVGLAIHPDGRLFVADTWNRRISVFDLNGIALTTFNVRGWYDELGNRPYLALDVPRSILYVTDPDGGRILVYDLNGNCVGSFGQYNRENPDTSQFATVGGIAVDGEGNVYVADAGFGRVLKFAPFPIVQPVSAGQSSASQVEVTAEVTDEVVLQTTVEVTPEVTELP